MLFVAWLQPFWSPAQSIPSPNAPPTVNWKENLEQGQSQGLNGQIKKVAMKKIQVIAAQSIALSKF